MMQASRRLHTSDPYCPMCGDALECTLRIRSIRTLDGQLVEVAFCETCGCGLGVAGVLH